MGWLLGSYSNTIYDEAEKAAATHFDEQDNASDALSACLRDRKHPSSSSEWPGGIQGNEARVCDFQIGM